MKDRLKKIRKDQNMTQAEFGASTGKGRDTVTSYELGRVIPDDSYIQLLAIKFNYSFDWIKTGRGDPKADNSIGVQMGEIVAMAAHNNPEDARRFFSRLCEDFSQAEILLIYELFRRRFPQYDRSANEDPNAHG